MMEGNLWQWRAHGPRLCAGVVAVLREASLWGLLVVLLVPAARGHHDWLGWWPLWLAGMPALAWWTAAGLVLPVRQPVPADVPRRRLRRSQARRRGVRKGLAAVTVGRGRAAGACASVRSQ